MDRDDDPAFPALDQDVRAALADHRTAEPAAGQQPQQRPARHMSILLDGVTSQDLVTTVFFPLPLPGKGPDHQFCPRHALALDKV